MRRGEVTEQYLACRTLRHAWDVIGAGDRRPVFGTLVCLRCVRCGTLRYDKYSRLTGERIGTPDYVWPEGYRDAEGHNQAWWRAQWAETVHARGLDIGPEDENQQRTRRRKS
jgi:hypothetical protein